MWNSKAPETLSGLFAHEDPEAQTSPRAAEGQIQSTVRSSPLPVPGLFPCKWGIRPVVVREWFKYLKVSFPRHPIICMFLLLCVLDMPMSRSVAMRVVP